MTGITELFSKLSREGIQLQVVRDNLKISAPKGTLTPQIVAQLKEHKADIVRYLQRRVGQQKTYYAIDAVEKKEYYPLSSAQVRFYVLQELAPRSTAYNMPAIYRVEGAIDKERLENSIKSLIRRHAVLRTSFENVNGQPVQRVRDTADFALDYNDLSEGDTADREFLRPFDLSQAPLLRIGLTKLGDLDHRLTFDIHHIISDGTSMGVFFQELTALYSGQSLPPLKRQYADFAQWQYRRLASGGLRKQEDYWAKQFPGEVPVLNMPTDFPRPPQQSFEGDVLTFSLDADVAAGLKELMKETGTTLYMAMLAVYYILLSRYAGQEDIVIGTTIAGRNHPDLQRLMGLMIETLVQRNYPGGHLLFREFLEMVKQETLASHENQDYPFRELIHRLGADNEVSRNPVFDAMLIVQNYEMPEFETGDLRFSPYQSNEEDAVYSSKVDLTIDVMEMAGEGGIYFALEYCTRLYKRETMERLARHFGNIIGEVAADPDTLLSGIRMMNEAELRQLLEMINRPGTGEEEELKTVVERFEEQAARTPGNIAVESPAASLTYEQLKQRSGQLAHTLREKGIGPAGIVALMMEPSVEMVIAMWGVLKSGAAYLPIVPGSPEDRIDYIMKDSNAELLLTADNLMPELTNQPEIVSLAGAMNYGPATPTQLCYIIYTSGTTGRPKGVLVEHRNLSAYIDAFEHEFQLGPGDAVVQQVSYAFDASVEEFYPVLMKGGRIAIPGKEVNKDAGALCRFIGANKITMITCSPQLLNQMNTLASGYGRNGENPLASLRIIISGGDRLKGGYVSRLKTIGAVYNTYGPTESTVCATYYRCPEEGELPPGVPIGSPIHGYLVHVLDRYRNLAPIGVPGELCISGRGVTRGYLNQPEQTAERFVDYNYRSYRSHRSYKTYKTGDLCRRLPDGNLEFLGRIDRQVKIRGYRIELAEIERRLLALETVNDAVVVEMQRSSGENFLAAYVAGGDGVDASAVKDQLARHLPEYMIPPFILQLEAIPRTSSDKVDIKQLPRPEARGDSEAPFTSPGTETEKKLAAAWREILEVERVGIDDNFFDLGGTSLDIMKVSSSIKEIFGVEIKVVTLFRHTTIRALVRYIEREMGNTVYPGDEAAEAELLEAIEAGQDKLKGRVRGAMEPAQTAGRTGLEIAVIGMAGRFPGASNLDEYWQNLVNGVETITFFTGEELLEEGERIETLEDPNYVKAKGIVEGAEYFDASFFGYMPIEAQLMDPQSRVFHECAWHALEDAGYNPFAYNKRIGLYAGATPNVLWEGVSLFSPASRGLSSFMVAQLSDKDFMCTQVSYKLNLKGPAVSIQTACSTSLAAIHHGVKALLQGECEMALAGGVSIHYPQKQGYLYQEGMIFSPDGHNRSFDAKGQGSLFSDGAGVVLLKPLEDALADRDHIYAAIKGSAINNDGFRKAGYTAPSVQGQMEVIRAAQLAAETEPESITYVEAHGTATPLGDTVEIEALKQAFNTDKRGYCALGSVKSNFGHLYSAAGAAGFIKTVLALKHRKIPPSLHFETPNPQVDFENSPFVVNTALKEWRSENYPLRAGVSAFGIGGTNAHAVLEEAPAQAAGSAPGESRPMNLLMLSARSGSALGKLTESFIRHLESHPGTDLADAAYTLQTGRKHHPFRRMAVVPVNDTGTRAAAALQGPAVQVRDPEQPVFFMFCGQGSQYVNMGRELYHTETLFRAEMDRCFQILEPLMGCNIKEILYPGEDANEENDGPERIHQPEFTLPVLFCFEYALAKLLMAWGVRPAAMIGYSFGEYTAACLAGVFSLEDALNMMVTRGQLIQQTPEGRMTSVTLPEEELKPLLNPRLSIAIVNGPTCIVAGEKDDVEAFEQELKQKRIICVPLNMSHAVHSQIMNSIRGTFEQRIGQFRLHEPKIPFISNVTADWARAEEVTSPGYWGDHLCSTVRFSDGLGELLKSENGIFLEIGPGRILGMMVRVHARRKPGHTVLNTVKHPQEKVSDHRFLLDKLGQLWLKGKTIDWQGFYGPEKRRRIPLPGYPFEGKRFWVDPKVLGAGAGPGTAGQAGLFDGAAAAVTDPAAGPVQPVPLADPGKNSAPGNEIEKVIAQMWKELMGLDEVGIHDDFFSLNGSSLVATQIMARLMQIYELELSVAQFYQEPTIAHIAGVIHEMLEKKQN